MTDPEPRLDPPYDLVEACSTCDGTGCCCADPECSGWCCEICKGEGTVTRTAQEIADIKPQERDDTKRDK